MKLKEHKNLAIRSKVMEVFVIDAKGKFIKNKTVKVKRTKKGIFIIEDKTIADSANNCK